MNNISIGTIFQLDEHILGCGDARDKAFVARMIGYAKVSLIVADVPYGVNYTAGKKELTKIRKQKDILNDGYQTDKEYTTFTKDWLSAVKPFLTSKNAAYIFNCDRMLFALKDGLVSEDFHFGQLLIWLKNNVVLGRLNYLPQHELIIYAWYKTHRFFKSQDKSLLFYPKPNKSVLHPTQKPIGLLQRLILNSSKIGDVVYDPFLGSGSTLVAAELIKRRCIGIELDPEYCQTAITRFEKLTGKKAIQVKE